MATVWKSAIYQLQMKHGIVLLDEKVGTSKLLPLAVI
jgi:hypothetical protein